MTSAVRLLPMAIPRAGACARPRGLRPTGLDSRVRRRAGWGASAALACLVLAGCGPRRLAVVGPVPDAASAAASLIDRTRLVEPLQVVFGWEATDEGARASGRGVARVEPESKARLDLFLENGETALRAALVDGDLRLPEGVRAGILPPPDLLWATLGVVQPGKDALLSGADRLEGGAVRIRYGYPDGSELHYETFHGVLTRIDRLRGGRVVEEVALSFSEPGRYPTEATYRHRAEFREMSLTRETLRAVEPFPAEIWRPSR